MFNHFLTLQDFFNTKLNALHCQDTTKAYIVGTLAKYKSSTYDYSNQSLTLMFAEARNKNNFIIFQSLGDWILWCKMVYPEALNTASNSYYQSLAQSSYNACYNIINRKIDVYQNLSDEFVRLTNDVNRLIHAL